MVLGEWIQFSYSRAVVPDSVSATFHLERKAEGTPIKRD